MNIFVVDTDPRKAAQSLCDKHVVKMVLETAQILSTISGGPYRPGKGEWQVLQVKTPQYGWQVIYRRKEMPEHFSLNARLVSLVEKFLRGQS